MHVHIQLGVGLVVMAGMANGVPAWAASANAAAAPGMATGKVVKPIVLTHSAGAALSFGTFTTGTGGKVVVTTGGIGSVTKAVAFVPGLAGTSADQFTLSGAKQRTFLIATTGGSVTNGIDTMPFTTAPSSTSGSTTTTGTFSFTVGGKLTVAGGESGGQYTGTYTATVAYN